MDDLLRQGLADSSNVEPIYLDNRTEIVAYYKEEYGANWKQHIVDDRMAATPDAKRASIRREYEYDAKKGAYRYEGTKMRASTKEAYAQLGKTLPPSRYDLKSDSIKITIRGTQQGQDRSVSVTLRGSAAKQFVSSPSYGDVYASYGAPAGLFSDGDYAIDVDEVTID